MSHRDPKPCPGCGVRSTFQQTFEIDAVSEPLAIAEAILTLEKEKGITECELVSVNGKAVTTPPGKSDPMTQLTEAHWHALKEVVVQATNFHAAAEESLRNFVLTYLKQHPLSEAQKSALIDAFQAGRPLCCEKGRETLSKFVDPIWAQELNEWAYDSLRCSGDPKMDDYYLNVLKEKLEES